MLCLMGLLLAVGVLMLELALRLLTAAGWALNVLLWLASAAAAVAEAVRRTASPWVARLAAA